MFPLLRSFIPQLRLLQEFYFLNAKFREKENVVTFWRTVAFYIGGIQGLFALVWQQSGNKPAGLAILLEVPEVNADVLQL